MRWGFSLSTDLIQINEHWTVWQVRNCYPLEESSRKMIIFISHLFLNITVCTAHQMSITALK